MAQVMVMPKLGLTATEGVLTSWMREIGAPVLVGESICEVETTKIVVEVEAPVGGVLLRRIDPGETVPVGAPIAVIGEAGEDVSHFALFDPASTPRSAPAVMQRASEPRRRESASQRGPGKHNASPVARRLAEELGIALADVTGTGPDGMIGRDDVKRASAARANMPATRMIETGGRKLRVMSSGAGGVPVLLIHGFGADLGTWLLTMPALAQERAVYAFDLPCHGQSDEDPEADLAMVVNKLLDNLRVERVHLVGHSLGGAAALEAASERPERVASLTLIAAAGLGREINGHYIEAFVAARDRPAIEALCSHLFAEERRAGRQFVEELLQSKQRAGVEECLRRIADRRFPQGRQNPVLVDRLSAVGAPVQILWGVEDKVAPAAHARALVGSCTVRLIDQAGHMVHIEAADVVNREIRNFIEAAEARNR